MRTISSVTLASFAGGVGRLAGSSDGRPTNFNDEGDLMFFAGFADGGAGLLLANVPAIPLPPALVLFVSGLFGLLGLRRRVS